MKRTKATATIRLRLETSDPRLDKWQSETFKQAHELETIRQDLAQLAEVVQQLAAPKSKKP